MSPAKLKSSTAKTSLTLQNRRRARGFASKKCPKIVRCRYWLWHPLKWLAISRRFPLGMWSLTWWLPSWLARHSTQRYTFAWPHPTDHILRLTRVEHANQASTPNQSFFRQVLFAAYTVTKVGHQPPSQCLPSRRQPTHCRLKVLQQYPHTFHVTFANAMLQSRGLFFGGALVTSSIIKE